MKHAVCCFLFLCLYILFFPLVFALPRNRSDRLAHTIEYGKISCATESELSSVIVEVKEFLAGKRLPPAFLALSEASKHGLSDLPVSIIYDGLQAGLQLLFEARPEVVDAWYDGVVVSLQDYIKRIQALGALQNDGAPIKVSAINADFRRMLIDFGKDKAFLSSEYFVACELLAHDDALISAPVLRMVMNEARSWLEKDVDSMRSIVSQDFSHRLERYTKDFDLTYRLSSMAASGEIEEPVRYRATCASALSMTVDVDHRADEGHFVAMP